MRRCTTNDSASSVRLPSRGGSPLRPAPLTPAYPLPKGLPVQLGFFFGAPTPKKPRGPQWGAPRPVQAVTLSICPVMPCSEGRGSIVLRESWAIAHPLRILAPRHAAIRSGQVRRPIACRLVVARPAGGGGCVAGARVGGLEPSAPQRVPPQRVPCAAVVRSLCSERSLAAACRCSSDGSTLYFNRHLAPSANTGN